MPFIDRRAFLAGVAAVPALRVTATASTPVHGFIAESGKRGAWPLVIGLLATATPDIHELQIELLRRRHNYPRALRYMSTDRKKVPFASALIDYTAAARNLSFTALVVTDPAGRWPAIGTGKDTAYAAVYRRLIQTAASGEMVISLRHPNGDRRDEALRAYLSKGLGLGLVTAPSSRSNLGQLAAFLSGCVYGEASGVANPMKFALTGRLKRQMGDPAQFTVRTASI